MSACGKLNRKQEAVIAALLSERTHADAAARAGISEATLQRWLRLPAFQAEYAEARRRVLETALARLQQVAQKAVDALERNLCCGQPATEVRAAVAILELANPKRPVKDIESDPPPEEDGSWVAAATDDELRIINDTMNAIKERSIAQGQGTQAAGPHDAFDKSALGGYTRCNQRYSNFSRWENARTHRLRPLPCTV